MIPLRYSCSSSAPDILAAQGYVDLFNGKVSDGTSLAYLKRAYDHGARYEANLAANACFGVGQDYFGPGFVS